MEYSYACLTSFLYLRFVFTMHIIFSFCINQLISMSLCSQLCTLNALNYQYQTFAMVNLLCLINKKMYNVCGQGSNL
jgi:hypothetical protein